MLTWTAQRVGEIIVSVTIEVCMERAFLETAKPLPFLLVLAVYGCNRGMRYLWERSACRSKLKQSRFAELPPLDLLPQHQRLVNNAELSRTVCLCESGKSENRDGQALLSDL